MNSDTLLTHIRLEQRCLIDIDKKLHELECLLSCSDPIRFFEVAKNTALLSERSTAQLRSFLFTTLYCMTDDTGALCDQFQTTRFADSSCTIISVMQKEKFSAWLDMKNPAKSVKS